MCTYLETPSHRCKCATIAIKTFSSAPCTQTAGGWCPCCRLRATSLQSPRGATHQQTGPQLYPLPPSHPYATGRPVHSARLGSLMPAPAASKTVSNSGRTDYALTCPLVPQEHAAGLALQGSQVQTPLWANMCAFPAPPPPPPRVVVIANLSAPLFLTAGRHSRGLEGWGECIFNTIPL